MNDLKLLYQFTDRAGRHVYNIHSPDNRARGPVIGQIRFKPDEDIEGSRLWLHWKECNETDS